MQQEESNTNEYSQEVKPHRGRIALLVFFVLVAVAVFALLRSALTTKVYATYGDYKAAGGKERFEIPAGAKDCRFAIRKPILSKAYLYSFVLEENDYRNYIDELRAQYRLDSVEEDDVNYGYAHWYGMRVRDCHDADYELTDFPVALPFDSVSDVSIEEYTILLYRPMFTGSRTSGVVALEEEHRVVCFEFEAIK